MVALESAGGRGDERRRVRQGEEGGGEGVVGGVWRAYRLRAYVPPLM